MDRKKFFVLNEATLLRGGQMTVADLAVRLNAAGFRTRYGTHYQGLRGTYTLLRKTYHAVNRVLGSAQAKLIADSFTRPDGTLAWK